MKKVLKVLLGYLITIGIVACYVSLAAVLQIFFNMTPLISTMLSDVAVISICSFTYFRYVKKGVFSERRLKMNTSAWGHYLLIFVLSFSIIIIGFHWITIHFPDTKSSSVVSSFTEKWEFALYFVHAIVLAPISEEFLLRMCCHNILKKFSGFTVSAITISVIFGVLHATVPHLIFGTLFGFFMLLAYENTGHWYMSIIGHMIYNAFTLFFGKYFAWLAQYTAVFVIAQIVFAIILVRECMFYHVKDDMRNRGWYKWEKH